MKERDAAADAACMPMASGFCRLWRLLWLSLSLSLRATHSFLFLHWIRFIRYYSYYFCFPDRNFYLDTYIWVHKSYQNNNDGHNLHLV